MRLIQEAHARTLGTTKPQVRGHVLTAGESDIKEQIGTIAGGKFFALPLPIPMTYRDM